MTIETRIDTLTSRPIDSREPVRHPAKEVMQPAFMTINVRLADGSAFRCEAAEGFRVMELIRAYGLPIKAECGGAGVCATCHVRVPETWRAKLPEPGDEELAKLDDVPGADEHSRLACQIEMTANLDGLELSLDSDSLHPQSNWTAG